MYRPVKSPAPVGWTSPHIAVKFQAAMDEHRLTLARRVKHLREARGWSQGRLAREAHVSDKTISRIEQAKDIDTRPDTFDKLAEALRVPVSDLDAGRPTLAELEEADGPLERIERKLDEILSRLPDPAEEIERETAEAALQAARRDADSASSARSARRSGKAR